eukprot:6212176-Pleurochrysis_carterae.AAC.1
MGQSPGQTEQAVGGGLGNGKTRLARGRQGRPMTRWQNALFRRRRRAALAGRSSSQCRRCRKEPTDGVGAGVAGVGFAGSGAAAVKAEAASGAAATEVEATAVEGAGSEAAAAEVEVPAEVARHLRLGE